MKCIDLRLLFIDGLMKNALSSKLDSIKGIGPKSRNKLLRKFGSLKKIKEASIDELRDAGLTLTQAQTVKLTL